MNNQFLTLSNASDPKEKRYFLLLAFISSLFWIGIIVSLVGPIIVALLAILIWFLNGLFIAWIKAEGVKISEDQIPELYKAFLGVCSTLGIEKIPALYVVQSDGMLNAFATRHSRRDFIVLYSDIVESYGTNSPEISFLLGHEIGHIRKKHILKSFFLIPSNFIPLLWEAYSRACEATCDRHGALASNDLDASIKALMILSGGKEIGEKMNRESFVKQYIEDRGFFISCHELMSNYPTLSQRVFNIFEITNSREPIRSSRNLLAYPFSFLMSLLQSITIIFILAIFGVTILGKEASDDLEGIDYAELELDQNPDLEEENDELSEYKEDISEDPEVNYDSIEAEPTNTN